MHNSIQDTMKIPFLEGGGHWYTQTGESKHHTQYATGARKGEWRNTTLRDARKDNLLPSVTTVLGAYPKGNLDRWIKEQVVIAMHNNPPSGPAAAPITSLKDADEAQMNYFSYIDKLSNKRRDEAAARGTFLHDNVEAMILGKPWDESDAHLQTVKEWMDKNLAEVHFTEKNVVDLELKIAGRLDACLILQDDPRPIIVDYKGRGFNDLKRGPEPKQYKTDMMQLAFYAKATEVERIANLYIANDREQPLIYFYEYTPEQMQEAYEAFKHLVHIWQYDHSYEPEIEVKKLMKHMEAK